jgi:hypothetical protein
MCMIERNSVVGTRRVGDSEWTGGYGILVSYGSEADLRDNALAANARGAGAIVDSELHVRSP